MQEYEFKGAVDSIMALAAFGNTYIQTNAPWKLIKTDRAAASRVIKNSIQIAKALALLVEPVMPVKAQECWEQLGYSDTIAAHRVDEGTETVPERQIPPPLCLHGSKRIRSLSWMPCSSSVSGKPIRKWRRYR